MPPANSYEVERLARIAENKRRLAELGLVEASKELAKSCAKPKKVVVNQRTTRAPRAPFETRRSGRVADLPAPNYAPDGHIYAPIEYRRRATIRCTKASSSGTVGWNALKGQAGLDACAAAIEEAEEFITKLSNPAYFKVMTASQVSGGFWANAPRGLAEHVNSDKTMLRFQLPNDADVPDDSEYISSDGVTWEVVWLPHGKKSAGFSGGWRGFSIDVDLYPRDVIVFEVVKPRLFSVHIFRALDFEKAEDRDKRLAVSAAYLAALYDDEEEEEEYDDAQTETILSHDYKEDNDNDEEMEIEIKQVQGVEGGVDDGEECLPPTEVIGTTHNGNYSLVTGTGNVKEIESEAESPGPKLLPPPRGVAVTRGRATRDDGDEGIKRTRATTRTTTKTEKSKRAAAVKDDGGAKKKAKTSQKKKQQKPVAVEEEEEEEEERWFVDKILDVRTKANGTKLYYIQWVGYKKEESTWEPRKMLDADPKSYKRGPGVKKADL